jgi:predicted phosphodiesterase
MRVAIISDSHGNLTALDAVLADLDARGPYDEVLMGGDIAWGGPYPKECIDRIRSRDCRAVAGNTDWMITDAADGGDDPMASWILERLDAGDVAYLKNLPLQVNVEAGSPETTLALVHATPWSVHPAVRPDDGDDRFAEMLQKADTRALAYGHIHLQHARKLDAGIVVAVGAIGRPFDGDQRAMYAVLTLDGDQWSAEFRRVAYDVDAAIQETVQSGVPNAEEFANSLRTARSPH